MGRQILLALIFAGASAFGANSFVGTVVSGQIFMPDGTPDISSNVSFTLSVYSSDAAACLLYSETQTADLSTTNGNYNLTLGTGTSSSTYTLSQALANSGTFAGLTCASGTSYTPTSTDDRNLVVTFNDNSGSGSISLAAQAIKAVPFALQAQQISGVGISNLLRVSDSTSQSLVAAQVAQLASLPTTGFSANQILGMNASATGLEYKTLTAGSNITITPGTNSVTISASGGSSGVTSVTAATTAGNPIMVANTTTTPTIDIPAATSSQSGYLTSTDWSTFNGKQAAGTYAVMTTSTSSSGQVPVSNGTKYVPTTLMAANIFATDGTTPAFAAATCSTSQSMYFVSATGAFACQSITLPNPGASTLGGVESVGPITSKWINAISASGVPSLSQPSFSDLTGTAGLSQISTSGATTGQVLTYNGTSVVYSTVNMSSVGGTLSVANGGTGSNTALTGNQAMISSSGKIIEAGAMGNGQILIGANGAVPVPATLTSGTGIGISNGPNSIMISAVPPLSSVAAATGANSISNGSNGQVWQWSLSGPAQGMTFKESTASTGGGGGNQDLVRIATSAGSTANALNVFVSGSSTLLTNMNTALAAPTVNIPNGYIILGATAPVDGAACPTPGAIATDQSSGLYICY